MLFRSSGKFGSPSGHLTWVSAVAADGTYALLMSHFAHTAAFYAPDGKELGRYSGFNNANFDAPQRIDVGASGDFYALDERAHRVLRLSRTGAVVKTFPFSVGRNFRVCEQTESFYFGSPLQVVGFDGTEHWRMKTPCAAFDVTPDGTVYTLSPDASTVTRFDGDETLPTEIKLQHGGPLAPGQWNAWEIAVIGDELLLRRQVEVELFQIGRAHV